MEEMIHVKIRRQDSPDDLPYWEEFRVPHRPPMTVGTVLLMLAENPINADGFPTTPIAWDGSCLEEMCGSCAMVINGRARMSCSTMVDHLDWPIVIEPLSKFPLVRDLKVDRTRLFDTLERLHTWVRIDGFHDQGPGPRMTASEQTRASSLASCIMCGLCAEACPQFNDRSSFVGPAALGQAARFNQHPGNEADAGDRLLMLRGSGGIADCGHAQNCVAICPKRIPLAEAIASVNWDTTKQAVKKFLRG